MSFWRITPQKLYFLAHFPMDGDKAGLLWYNIGMAIDFGNGLILKDTCPWLRDDARRHEEILDVTERNSIIEGLPPFVEETRRQLREKLSAMSGQRPTPRG